MARILMAWELGLNLGHVARLAPVAMRLRAQGHSIKVVVRDTHAAAMVLGGAGIDYATAPVRPLMPMASRQLSGYAELLQIAGWDDPKVLFPLVAAWHEHFRAFRPDVVVLDHAPTVRFAARLAGLPTLALGNGFELPPLTHPLPIFPGIAGVLPENAAKAEEIVFANVLSVAKHFAMPLPSTLKDILLAEKTCLATFPELDHYGNREGVEYIGPMLGGVVGEFLDWPMVNAPRIFAYLRPDTRQLESILGGLLASNAAVICFSPGISPEMLTRFRSSRLRFSQNLVDIARLLTTADACLSYGAEGTMMRFLLAGIPQIIMPGHVEAAMAAARFERLGVALVLRGVQNAQSIAANLRFLVSHSELRDHAQNFSERHKWWQPQAAVDRVLACLGELIPLESCEESTDA